jgi:Raf kinase inhibitor-like YbhB/YbcL family protein
MRLKTCFAALSVITMVGLLTESACVAPSATAAEAKPFTLILPSHPGGRFDAKNSLPASYGFGCDGANVSPAVRWENPPEGTRSFVLTVHDGDAPTGIGWMHWVVTNIPADARAIPETASGKSALLPKGAVESRTDFGAPGFGGPCPPQGTDHRYTFTLTALKIDVMPGFVNLDAMPALVGFITKANALGEATAVLRYSR